MAILVRPADFEYGDDFDPAWHPRLPEFACAANAVSLLMPYAEPYVVKSVRAALPDLAPDLRAETEAYLRQELQHHVQHRRFNDLVASHYRGVSTLERVMRRVFTWLHRTRSRSFNLAFAAGFETIAYCGARWTEARLGRLTAGADETAMSLFIWHLAEEVEHKTVAFDVYRAAGGGRFTHLLGLLTSFVLLALFTMTGTLVLLAGDRRLWHPMSHLRLAGWAISFAFDLLPAMAVSLMPGHHPSKLVDPTWFRLWLDDFERDRTSAGEAGDELGALAEPDHQRAS